MVPIMEHLPYNLRRTLVSKDPGGFMHWLKLLMEGWVVFGIVTVVAGLIWTARLSREMDPEISEGRSQSEPQFGTAPLSKLSA